MANEIYSLVWTNFLPDGTEEKDEREYEYDSEAWNAYRRVCAYSDTLAATLFIISGPDENLETSCTKLAHYNLGDLQPAK